MSRTGRENAMVVYCRYCDWHEDGDGVAMVNQCPTCGRPLGFVRYERGVEEADVKKIIPSFVGG